MRSLVILFAGLFSFFYIDLRPFRKPSKGVSLEDSISIELFENKQKHKRKHKKYKNRKYKKRKTYRPKHYKLKGTKSKDSRYSNQKDIRRMHTNYS